MQEEKIVIERCIHGLDINFCYLCQVIKKSSINNLENMNIDKDEDRLKTEKGV